MEKTAYVVRGLRDGTAMSPVQAEGFTRRMIAEGVIRPTGKLGSGGETSAFAFPRHTREATACIAFLHGLGLRDRDTLTGVWTSLLTPTADGETPIAKVLRDLETRGCDADLPALRLIEFRAVDDPSDVLGKVLLLDRHADLAEPPAAPEGYTVAWHLSLRLGTILAPFVTPASEAAH